MLRKQEGVLKGAPADQVVRVSADDNPTNARITHRLRWRTRRRRPPKKHELLSLPQSISRNSIMTSSLHPSNFRLMTACSRVSRHFASYLFANNLFQALQCPLRHELGVVVGRGETDVVGAEAADRSVSSHALRFGQTHLNRV